MTNQFTNSQILKWAAIQLHSISGSPNLDVEVLFRHVSGQNQIQIATEQETELDKKTGDKYQKLIKKCAEGIPVAYLTGKKEFFSREFKVTPDVLIPRPETEGLVELALNRITRLDSGVVPRRKNYELRIKILDLGTGSGNIAISLAGLNAQVTATDISKKALIVAKNNAKGYNANIKFIHSDLFENLKGRKFDLIIANLPYVRETDYQKNLFELQAEPKIALTDGTNNWLLIIKFLRQLPQHINHGGIVYMEIDPGAVNIIKKAVKQHLPESKIKFHQDLASRWRYVEIIV